MSGMTFTESDIALIKKLGGMLNVLDDNNNSADILTRNNHVQLRIMRFFTGQYCCMGNDCYGIIKVNVVANTLKEVLQMAVNTYKTWASIPIHAGEQLQELKDKMTEEK